MNFLKIVLLFGGGIIMLILLTVNHSRVQHDNSVEGTSIYSPDKYYKAVVFRKAGGGGISPYCTTVISVVPANTSDAIAYQAENRVYTYSECQDFGAESLRWNSNEELNIAYKGLIQLKTLSSDGKIRIVKANFTKNDIK